MVSSGMKTKTKLLTAEETQTAVQEAELLELKAIFEQINQAGQETLQRIDNIHLSIQDMLKEVRSARTGQDRAA